MNPISFNEVGYEINIFMPPDSDKVLIGHITCLRTYKTYAFHRQIPPASIKNVRKTLFGNYTEEREAYPAEIIIKDFIDELKQITAMMRDVEEVMFNYTAKLHASIQPISFAPAPYPKEEPEEEEEEPEEEEEELEEEEEKSDELSDWLYHK